MEEILEILSKNKDKKEIFKSTIKTVCCKASTFGSYEDYGVFADIIKILKCCEAVVLED